MALVYDESVKGDFAGVDLSRANATAAYLKHYDTKLYLSFMAKNGNRDERWQAEKELQICERKMKYWERHHNFDGDAAVTGMEDLNRKWQSKR